MQEQIAINHTHLPDYETARKKALYFGLLGADRRYIGDKRLGTAKLVLSICSLGLYGLPWWIADYIIITRHKDDWEEWISRKQASQRQKQQTIEQAKKAQAEAKELEKFRMENGRCVKCGSDRIQGVVETNSSAQLTDAVANIIPHGATHLEQKIRSKTMILCLNCGHKRAV